jgi:alkyl sulfatase BDS1-like metallo-beta-lactamase superfamily hydrolase
MTARPALLDQTPIAASVLVLLDGIERYGPEAPAAIAFSTALKRKGAEAFDSGGPAAVERLLQEIVAADPGRAAAREALARAAWSNLTGPAR